MQKLRYFRNREKLNNYEPGNFRYELSFTRCVTDKIILVETDYFHFSYLSYRLLCQ